MNTSKSNLIKIALPYLACPNDENNLEYSESNLFCNECNSEYKILDNNFLELLPKTSFELKRFRSEI